MAVKPDRLQELTALLRETLSDVEKMGCTCADDIWSKVQRSEKTGHERGCQGLAAADNYEKRLRKILR